MTFPCGPSNCALAALIDAGSGGTLNVAVNPPPRGASLAVSAGLLDTTANSGRGGVTTGGTTSGGDGVSVSGGGELPPPPHPDKNDAAKNRVDARARWDIWDFHGEIKIVASYILFACKNARFVTTPAHIYKR
jgi:hypothetical protein